MSAPEAKKIEAAMLKFGEQLFSKASQEIDAIAAQTIKKYKIPKKDLPTFLKSLETEVEKAKKAAQADFKRK